MYPATRAHLRAGSARSILGGLLGALSVLATGAVAEQLQYGDGVPDGKKSFGGGGHLITFDAGTEGRWLNRIEMHGSRYGAETPPDEDFGLYVVDMAGDVLHRVALPYSLWERGDDYWRDLPIPPIQVPQQFGIGLTFDAHQTKGVYVAFDNVGQTHSYSWVPGTEAKPMEGIDWMVWATVEDQPAGDPEAADLVVLKSGEAFFDRLLGAEGEPLGVNTAEHGVLPEADIASIRLRAITSPGEIAAVVLLANGLRVEGQVLYVDAETLRLRDVSGAERTFPRSEVARVDFQRP